jgi:glycosyltransferase involved in cell wall biosynthesis
MAAGRAIVSTPYTYAAEVLDEGRGILVPPGSPERLAAALNDILGNHELRAALSRRAYAYSRGMVWSAVGAQYRTVFDGVTADAFVDQRSGPLAVVNA